MSVIRSAGVDDVLVVGRPLPEPALVRVPAAADEVADEQPVRCDRALGEQRQPARYLAVDTDPMGLPVEPDASVAEA